MAEYEIPSFLQKCSTDEFYEKIKEILPEDISLSEGGHGWNMTRPIALVAAEICEFILPEVVKLILPEWSYGDFLVGHAKARGIIPREAIAATGEITITGEANTTIPAGSLFSVPSVNNEPSVDYATIQDATILQDGSVTVGVKCTQAGTIGNTPANTIVFVSSKLSKITSVTNAKAIEGGTEADSDEDLKEKIEEYDATQGYSFVGNDADYKRWAEECSGGTAKVIPAEDDSAVVTIILTDEEGQPASKPLCDKVYDYIMSPDDRNKRKAPIGAQLDVTSPSTFAIGIKATIELEENATLDAVKKDFIDVLELYLAEALDEEEVKYSQVWAKLALVEGVADFKNLEIGIVRDNIATYDTKNIPIEDNQLPSLHSDFLDLTTGEV